MGDIGSPADPRCRTRSRTLPSPSRSVPGACLARTDAAHGSSPSGLLPRKPREVSRPVTRSHWALLSRETSVSRAYLSQVSKLQDSHQLVIGDDRQTLDAMGPHQPGCVFKKIVS